MTDDRNDGARGIVRVAAALSSANRPFLIALSGYAVISSVIVVAIADSVSKILVTMVPVSRGLLATLIVALLILVVAWFGERVISLLTRARPVSRCRRDNEVMMRNGAR